MDQGSGQYDQLKAMFDWAFDLLKWFAGLVSVFAFGLGGAVLGYFLPKTKKDMEARLKENADELFKQKSGEVFDGAQKLVQEKITDFESRASEAIAKVATLEIEIESGRYENRRIVWVFERDQITGQRELEALYSQGLTNIQTLTPETGEPFEIGDCDLVILSYDKSDEAKRRLKNVVGALKSVSPPVNLIIYTYNDGKSVRLDKDEEQILSGFMWHLPANFPMTLVSNAKLLVRQSAARLGGLHG